MTASGAREPNIVYLMADELAYYERNSNRGQDEITVILPILRMIPYAEAGQD